MTTVGWLPAPVEDLFGTDATAEESYEVLTVDVPPASWTVALRTARDDLGCTYFDWLSAVDEPGTGFRVSAHVVALAPVRRLLLRTTVPHESPALASAVDVYAGAAWHERETHEMFGVVFEGHPALDHLLLPEAFEGHPLRKDFVLAARVAKAWPGAKEPGESDHGGPKRRQMLPPGVPDPNEWGPLKGQLPPAPARPARGAGRAAGERPARAAGERPARRTRTAAEGSASQAAVGAEGAEGADAPTGSETPATPQAPTGQRRARSAAEGSASQRTVATEGPASQQPSATEGPATQQAGAPGTSPTPARPTTPPRSSDAPWHHARPAFDEPGQKDAEPERPEPERPEPERPEPERPEPERPEPERPEPERPEPDADAEAVPPADRAPEAPQPDDDPAPDKPTPENPTGGPR
ncbi:NADH-quinone oxidoreductase subunit C [Streptomyces sp. HUAS ZL42]|uniref:NADH-quinone oxidoreductase subunit C n=1 Tax=Streptomyces sp. HUAS ZL42 TaxID=3231715 RepID=UPI00345E6F8B